jgi:hypothetical protein
MQIVVGVLIIGTGIVGTVLFIGAFVSMVRQH